jgi:hypothetical protein
MFMRHSNSNKTLRSLYRYSALLTRMESQSFYQGFSGDYLMVLDSGLFYKVANILILLDEKHIDSATDEIYSRLPVIPDGMIHLRTSPEIIYDRIFKREGLKSKMVQEFKDVNKDKVYNRILLEGKINLKGVEILKSRGVKVIEVNASKDISLQLKTAITFVEWMKTGADGYDVSKIEPQNTPAIHLPEKVRSD